jgi:hypothetical protein
VAALSATAWAQTPASQPVDPWERMNAQFVKSSRAMLQEHAQLPPELARLAHTKTVVPPLESSSVDNPDHFVTLTAAPVARIVELLTPAAYRLPTYEDVLLPSLQVDPGRAKLEVNVKATAVLGPAKGSTAVTIEGKRTILAVAANAAPVFMDPHVSLETAARAKLDGPVTLEFKQTLMENDAFVNARELKIGYQFRFVEAAVGFGSKDGVIVEVGKDFAVKTGHGEYSAGLEARGTVPARLDPPWLMLTLASSEWGHKFSRLIAKEIVCPYCKGFKRAHCPKCDDKLAIACPKCDGAGGLPCSSCEGKGQVPCPTRVACGNCGGSGQLRCSACRGSGSVTVWETQTGTRQELVVDNVGFDSAGQPVYERHYEPRPYTEQVSKRQTCDACDGSGDGGTCDSCAGSGQVTCPRCHGTGLRDCFWCSGSGRSRCWTCWGRKTIACPMCSGRVHACQACDGAGRLRPE